MNFWTNDEDFEQCGKLVQKSHQKITSNWMTDLHMCKNLAFNFFVFIFQSMARDPKNIWQETPKQIRQKVLKFITIHEQFAVYAKERGLLE